MYKWRRVVTKGNNKLKRHEVLIAIVGGVAVGLSTLIWGSF